MIPFNRASFDGREMEYLNQAVAEGHISGQGPFSRQAEDILEKAHGAPRALLTTSCTHALELGALLAQLEPGDEVIVPSFTFVTSASAFMLHGATPVFVDVRSDTLNLDLAATEAAVTDRTRAICLVHYGGVAAEPEAFADLAARRDLTLIEDNAHGLFGSFRGRMLGTFGSLSTLSFHETKNLTCGEGGALIINDADMVARAEILREKGTDRSRFLRGQVDKYTWVDVGSSWVPSDLLAAVLVGQLERAEAIQLRRKALWDRYAEGLAEWAEEHGVDVPVVPEGCEHTSHLFHLRFGDIATRDRYITHLRDHGASAVFHYQPLHLSAVGRELGGRDGQCPVSERAGDTLVRLPLFVSLTDHEQDSIVDATRAFRP